MAEQICEQVPGPLAGERLDRIVAMLSGCSRSAARGMVEQGLVKVDSVAVRQASAKIESGSVVEFEAEIETTELPGPDASVDVNVIYEDDDVVVVNKPSGLVVHPGSGRKGDTLVNGLLARYPQIANVGAPDRPGIVHRLDGETSGLLMVALTDRAYSSLVAQLKDRSVTRSYVALAHGFVADDEGIIDAPIGRSAKRRTRMALQTDGRKARTHYSVVARSDGAPELTRLECRLETGRTHQIRVHLAAIGHPVVGDSTYGRRIDPTGFSRVALHAATLGFVHPVTDEFLTFESAVPADLDGLMGANGLNARPGEDASS